MGTSDAPAGSAHGEHRALNEALLDVYAAADEDTAQLVLDFWKSTTRSVEQYQSGPVRQIICWDDTEDDLADGSPSLHLQRRLLGEIF